MMRAIKMAVAAVGLAGVAAVTTPACAQVFWPDFGIVPYYNYYYYYPPYQPAFWGAYGYSGNRPLWRRYHPYGYYRSPSWRQGRRHAGIYGARRGFARVGGDRHRGSRGHPWYGSAGFGGYGSRGHGSRGVGGVRR